MKRSHISSPRSYSRPAISIFSVFLLFLLGLTLTSRKPSDPSFCLAPNRNLSRISKIPKLTYLVTGTKGDSNRDVVFPTLGPSLAGSLSRPKVDRFENNRETKSKLLKS
ncbi:hypothetical protein ARALYDRAFT_893858 [Arabidopsis lyrata subsp. lyrata]|uniref:Uncharacterized protein n=1 Tax=Arabidopsis lyrata subsp. lyrata TaxID=81972 RepID=D7KZ54_ARALL|nr:hypothetical protein ARALYDRAFT_893858 [Arabidopsis lyrata subsp. lyrata]